MDDREHEAADREIRRMGDEIERLQRQLDNERRDRAVRIQEALDGHLAAVGPNDPVDIFLAEVRAEIRRARAKFPGDRVMTVALAEEFGELCKAVLDEPSSRVRKEAVQTATMAARLVLDGDSSVAEWRKLKGLDPLVDRPAADQRWTCPKDGLVGVDDSGCCVRCGADLQPVRLEAKTEEHPIVFGATPDGEPLAWVGGREHPISIAEAEDLISARTTPLD